MGTFALSAPTARWSDPENPILDLWRRPRGPSETTNTAPATCSAPVLSVDISRTYAEYLAESATGAEPDEDSLIEAHTAEMKDWEVAVLKAEMQRAAFVARYRNPSSSSQDSPGIAYQNDSQTKIVRPEFLFFAKQSDGSIAADILDPQSTQFSDALPKLQGLAAYAVQHAAVYRRVEGIAKVGDKLQVLDLTDPTVRAAVTAAADAVSLYEGPHASEC